MNSLSEADRSALRLSAFGMVFQSGYLVPELSLLENAALPSWLLGAKRDTARSRAEEMFERLGIAEVAGRLPAEVSGGQLQRAAVARALAHGPRVVFADEPTGALDSTNSVLVFDALCEQAAALGALVVVVTHETALAQRCERVITLSDGLIESDRMALAQVP